MIKKVFVEIWLPLLCQFTFADWMEKIHTRLRLMALLGTTLALSIAENDISLLLAPH